MPSGNKRIFYAVEQVGFAEIGSQSFTAAHGVQSVGITTAFNLEQVFELGQISIYENIENIPDVTVTAEKVLDGYPLLYHLATKGSTAATMAGRSAAKTIVGMSVFTDTWDSASGDPIAEVQMSGMYISAYQYTFPVDGNFTESVTLVGNNKVWNTSAPWVFTGQFIGNNDEPLAIAGSGGVNRREDIIFGPGNGTSLDENGAVDSTTSSILPQDIDGVSSSGTVELGADGFYDSVIQNITCSTDLGREELFQLGKRTPYHRFVNFPVEVTTDIEVYGLLSDNVDATEEGTQGDGNNLVNRTIKIKAREGTFIDLGTKNKLANQSWQGGDATGGNVTITYSYTNFNDFKVQHPNDPTTALRI